MVKVKRRERERERQTERERDRERDRERESKIMVKDETEWRIAEGKREREREREKDIGQKRNWKKNEEVHTWQKKAFVGRFATPSFLSPIFGNDPSIHLNGSFAWRFLTSATKSEKRSLQRTYYRKRGRASYIVREVRSVRERERERDGSGVTEGVRRKWRHHWRAKIGDEFTLSLASPFWRWNSQWVLTFRCQVRTWWWVYTFLCQKIALFVSPFTLPISSFLNSHHCGAEIRSGFSLSVAKNFALSVPTLKWRDCSFHRKNESN